MPISARTRSVRTRESPDAGSRTVGRVDAASGPTRRGSLSSETLERSRATTHQLSTNHVRQSRPAVGCALQETLGGFLEALINTNQAHLRDLLTGAGRTTAIVLCSLSADINVKL